MVVGSKKKVQLLSIKVTLWVNALFQKIILQVRNRGAFLNLHFFINYMENILN